MVTYEFKSAELMMATSELTFPNLWGKHIVKRFFSALLPVSSSKTAALPGPSFRLIDDATQANTADEHCTESIGMLFRVLVRLVANDPNDHCFGWQKPGSYLARFYLKSHELTPRPWKTSWYESSYVLKYLWASVCFQIKCCWIVGLVFFPPKIWFASQLQKL